MDKLAFAAAQDWIVNTGNKYVDRNMDSVLLDPAQRAKTFDRMTSTAPRTFLQQINPLTHLISAYTNDPRAQQHMRQAFAQRLQNPQFVGQMFGREMGTGEALGRTLGATGVGGLATAGVGGLAALRGRGRLGLATGVGGLGATAWRLMRQKQKATDPGTWAQAFGSQQNTGAQSDLHAASTLYSRFGPKTAALNEDLELAPHQQRALAKFEKLKALLAYHQLGSGKTLLSIAGTEGRPTDVVVPASLRANYEQEVDKFTDGESPRSVRSFEHMQRHGRTPGAKALVVDEAHRLGTTDSDRSQVLQDLAKKYDRRLLLTGSPIRNRPSELAPLLKILNPDTKIPTDPVLFDRLFLEQRPTRLGFFDRLRGLQPGVETKAKNLNLLRRELQGKVDFHATDTSEFPETKEHEHRVPMGKDQYRIYQAVTKANPSLAAKVRRNLELTSEEMKSLNAFSTAARMASNNPHMYGGPDISPKLEEIAKRIRKGGKHFVYSNYLEGGVDGVAKRLEGIPHGVFSGALSDDERRQLVEDYNSGKIRALLSGPSGAEGLNLKETSDVHILEPHWNEPRADQAVGRAVRFRSHAALPEDRRKVNIHRYLATPPAPGFISRLFGGKQETGIDEYLAEMGRKKTELNNQFLDVLKEVGMEKVSQVWPKPGYSAKIASFVAARSAMDVMEPVEDRTTAAARFLNQHFPGDWAKRQVQANPNLSLGQQQAITEIVDREMPSGRGAVGFKDVVPSLVGAGLGWGGASMVGRLFNIQPKNRNALNLAGAALGGILNNPRIF